MQNSAISTRNSILVLAAIFIGISISLLDWRGLALWLGLATVIIFSVRSEYGILLGIALTALSRFLIIGINLQLADMAFLLFGTFWLIQRLYQERPISLKLEPAVAFLILGAATALCSFFVTSSFGVSLGNYVQLFYLVALTAILVVMFDDKKFLLAAMWIFVLAAGGISIYGVLGFFTGGARVIGTFDNPNVYSSYVIAIIPMAWALTKRIRQRTVKALIYILMAFMTMGLLLSLSRKGWIALALQIFFLAMCSKKRKLYIGVLIALLALTVILWPFLSTLLPEQIIDRALGFTSDSSTVTSRVKLFQISFDLIRAHPIFGVGLEMFSWYAPINSHSTWIGLWTEIGTVGVLPFIAALGIVSVGFLFWSFGRKEPDYIINALAASFFGLFFISQFGNIIFFRHFWIVLAMSIAALKQSGRGLRREEGVFPSQRAGHKQA
mgnify:CR=1 FL=1|jgi:hypothetical protein